MVEAGMRQNASRFDVANRGVMPEPSLGPIACVGGLLCRPMLDPQPPIPAGTYGVGYTAWVAWLRHVAHHLGCWPAVSWALLLGGPPLAWVVLVRCAIQHHEDWRRVLQSVSDAAGAPLPDYRVGGARPVTLAYSRPSLTA